MLNVRLLTNGALAMPNKYKKQSYLVVEPALSYLSVAQHISAAKWKKVQKEFGDYAKEEIKVVPYCPQLHATLLAKKQSQPAYVSPLQSYMQAVEEDIKEEIQHAKNVQRLNTLCAAHTNVHSIFSKNKKRKPVAANSSHVVLQFPNK